MSAQIDSRSAPSGSLGSQIRILTVRLAPYLRHLERRYALDPADSADLVQEALIRYSIHRASIRNPFAWLTCVLRRGCLRLLHLRAPGVVSLEELSERDSAALSKSSAANSDHRLQLEKVVSGLSPRHRRVLWMRFVAGMNWREIASALDCKTTSAKKAVARAIAAAREGAASV